MSLSSCMQSTSFAFPSFICIYKIQQLFRAVQAAVQLVGCLAFMSVRYFSMFRSGGWKWNMRFYARCLVNNGCLG